MLAVSIRISATSKSAKIDILDIGYFPSTRHRRQEIPRPRRNCDYGTDWQEENLCAPGRHNGRNGESRIRQEPLSDLVARQIHFSGVASSLTCAAAGRMTLSTAARKDVSNCSRAVFSLSNARPPGSVAPTTCSNEPSAFASQHSKVPVPSVGVANPALL
jgi:hypothetical protein